MSKKRKLRQLKKGEVRVIKMEFDAIAEFVWEAFTPNGDDYFDLDDLDDDLDDDELDDDKIGESQIYSMILDPDLKTLTFAACRVDELNSIDMDAINASLSKTTDSMYSNKRRYITLHLDS